MSAALTFQIQTLYAAAEAAYGDNTVDSLDAGDVLRIEEGTVVWVPLAAEDTAQGGGGQFAPDVYVGARLDVNFNMSLLPTRIDSQFTARPHGWDVILACGAQASTVDEGAAEAYDTGTDTDGTVGPFAFNSAPITSPVTQIFPGTVSIYLHRATASDESFVDDGAGNLTGSLGGSGSINYSTGAVTGLTFNSAPATGRSILMDYKQLTSTSGANPGFAADGASTSYTFTLPYTKVDPSSLAITWGSLTIGDDGAGNITGLTGSGTIDYTTGEIVLAFAAADVTAAGTNTPSVSWDHMKPGPYRLQAKFKPWGHGSCGVKLQARNTRPGGKFLQFGGKGARWQAVLAANTQNKLMLQLTGRAIEPVMEQAADDLHADPFPRGLPAVHTTATATLVGKLTQRGQAADQTFTGIMQNVEARPNFRLEALESATTDGGFDAVELISQDQQLDIETRMTTLGDSGDLNWYTIATLSAPIESTIAWKDVLDASNHIRLLGVSALKSEGLEMNPDRNGVASVTTKGKVISGVPAAGLADLPGGLGAPTQPWHGTDPRGDLLVLEWRTDPTLNPQWNVTIAA